AAEHQLLRRVSFQEDVERESTPCPPIIRRVDPPEGPPVAALLKISTYPFSGKSVPSTKKFTIRRDFAASCVWNTVKREAASVHIESLYPNAIPKTKRCQI
ncbi:hypothetical protein KUCAC02_031871, partial [Chaenocephalus aceratus]